MYGKTITCSEIGNSVSKAYQLKKKGKSKEDIYWEITPEDSTYIRQDIYTILIDVGMAADAENHKLFTEACRKNGLSNSSATSFLLHQGSSNHKFIIAYFFSRNNFFL